MTRGTWLVTRTIKCLVDAESEQNAIAEHDQGRSVYLSDETTAVPRYTGVVTDFAPPRFPGHVLCKECRGDHWTRDHERATP